MRRSTVLRFTAAAVLADLSVTSCGTGTADNPANAGQTSQAAQPTATDTGTTLRDHLGLPRPPRTS
ncbi:hypothetical protein ABZX30_10990 [Streptomyces sp. NPDC004542]|uniref:hypothetical protein n=1 Tax=Streptomyces sp. NPDC004542 TaxID=3154281 RepID=UPI0033A7276C